MAPISSYTDEQLMTLLAKGNETAFETIYKQHWLALYNTAFKYLKNTQQAEDVVQDIFAKLWAKRQQLSINNIAAYLHTAVRYRIIGLAEHGKVEDRFFKQFDHITEARCMANIDLAEQELLRLLNLYIEALPPKRKEIFLLYIHEQLSTKEIAEHLSLSLKTVQNQLHKAKQSIAEKLSPSLSLLFLSLFH